MKNKQISSLKAYGIFQFLYLIFNGLLLEIVMWRLQHYFQFFVSFQKIFADLSRQLEIYNMARVKKIKLSFSDIGCNVGYKDSFILSRLSNDYRMNDYLARISSEEVSNREDQW